MSSSIDRSTSREIWEISKRKDDAYGKYPETRRSFKTGLSAG